MISVDLFTLFSALILFCAVKTCPPPKVPENGTYTLSSRDGFLSDRLQRPLDISCNPPCMGKLTCRKGDSLVGRELAFHLFSTGTY